MTRHLAQILGPEPGPDTLKTRPWGGDRLATLRDPSGAVPRPIGESWEFSTMPGSESRSGGRLLSEVLGRPLPFLAKLLDTANDLSIQVHPQDDAETGRPGKEEAWVVLDADPDARVLAGLRDGITQPQFAAAVDRVRANRADGDELVAMLCSIPVRTGTVVLVPAGTVHAVGGGVLIAEIQQPTDCTYRLFDYGSDRELHLDAALSATRVDARPTVWQPGDDPGRLSGTHLDLEVLGTGRHAATATQDLLLVTVGGSCTCSSGGTTQTWPAGTLRLATPGVAFELHVPSGSGIVLGAIR